MINEERKKEIETMTGNIDISELLKTAISVPENIWESNKLNVNLSLSLIKLL